MEIFIIMKDIANLKFKYTPEISRSIFKALQARIHSDKFIRAYPALGKPKSFEASLTVEAALILPLILFMGVSLTLPVKMMDMKRQTQNTMEASAKDVAVASYVQRLMEEGDFFDSEDGGAGDMFENLELLETAYLKTSILSSLDSSSLTDPMFEKAEIGDDDIIDLELSYKMKMPFEVLGISHISMESKARRRAWTGSDGGRGRDIYGEKLSEDEDFDEDDRGDITVYVGKTSTRYHMDKNCHYLSNKLKAVDASRIPDLRNDSGGKYHPCPSCNPEGRNTVYIMSSGTAYHSSEHCKAIIAYVEEAKLRDVEHLGPCSYCCKEKH